MNVYSKAENRPARRDSAIKFRERRYVFQDRQPHRGVRTRLRLHLSSLESTGQLALLGALVGILSAVVLILFRELINTVQIHFLPAGKPKTTKR